ncbi:Polysaccharide biosynthesis protein [hydrothermal vent metagenome]|uniref:Polysaccharide biosynthesis protein n=1 Tax=hydrothermal vent metagenome TaxID=652676 RepID=A0A3B0WZT7_9ZZZZ
MSSSTKKIASSTAIYGIGTMLRGVSSFILLPLYTTYLAVADYGLIELLNIVLDLAVLLLGSRVAVGVFKFYSDAPDSKSKARVIGTAMLLLIAVNLLAIFIIYLFTDTIVQLLGAPDDFGFALRVFSISLLFAACNEIYFSYLRIEDKPAQYVAMNFVKLMLQIFLNILFIVYLEKGFWGIIWGAVISNFVVTIIFTFKLMPRIGFGVSLDQCKHLINFSWPIIVSSIGMYYITFGDRYFIQYYHTIETVGIYALAYKFGFMLFALIWVPFSTYWSANQFEHAKQPGAEVLFGNVFLFANVILIAAASGMIVLAPGFIYVFAQEEYWPAVEVVPWVVAAYVLQCWTEYVRFGILNAAKTRYIAYATYITVILITGLYYMWIPLEGAVGAAKATLVAFIVRFGIIYYFSQGLFRIAFPWSRLIMLIAYFSGLSIFITVLIPDELWALLLKASVVLFAIILLFFTPILEREHRLYVREAVCKLAGNMLRKISWRFH